MKVTVLGTGMVGRALAAKLAEAAHDVVIGTRVVETTLARAEPDRMGNPPYAQWQADHPVVRLMPFAAAGRHGEIIINATPGEASVAALNTVGVDTLAGKVILDVANPLEFSTEGPILSPVNTDSLAEQIQRAFPLAKVVKSLNTMNARVMVDPSRVPGKHNVFVAGDDAEAKLTVTGLLREFGWADDTIIDLGDLRAARSSEMYLPLWLSLRQALGTSDFNIHVVRA